MQVPVRTLVLIVSAILLSGCGSAPPAATATAAATETLAPTAVPTATATPTPMPVPGITEPIEVNGVSVRVVGAAWEAPVVGSAEQGYESLKITLELSGPDGGPADLLNQLTFREVSVLDENGAESYSGFFNLPLSDVTDSEAIQIEMFFGILEGATPVSIRFADGQSVELATLLEP